MTSRLPETSYRTSSLPFVMPGRSAISSPASLVEAVQAAVQRIEACRLRPVVARTASLAFQPRVMLAVLTYCYAQQVYSASDILHYLIRDEAFSQVCQGEFPNAREIETFRQQNRSVIETCLNAALRFLAEQKVAAGFVTRANETFIAEDAKRRIIMAACLDSLELAYENQPFVAVSE